MPVTDLRFERIAQMVSDRTAELLAATTLVVSPEGRVVASSRHEWCGLPLTALEAMADALAVPFRFGGQESRVLIRPEGEEPLSPRLAHGVVELVLGQALMVDRLPGQQELKNTFIHDLLRGHLQDEETLLRQARILGMDLGPPRAVILIDASAYLLGPGQDADRVQQRAQLVVGSVVGFFRLPNDSICAYIGEGEVAVLKASDTRNLSLWAEDGDGDSSSWANLAALKRAGNALLTHLHTDLGTPLTMGIGRYHRGLGGLARSYRDARAALSLGSRLSGEHRVHTLDALGIAAFVGLADEPTKLGLAQHLLSPLDGEPELLGTLEAFFAEDCRPLAAARRLGLHRNTLNYRLDKITSLTGLNPRTFDHAVQIRLALLIRHLQGEARPPL
ncbi:CdaR family transcriptional regulator [Deinococcus sp. YIM 77859]|uniref:PucR family transcriptional regulator n=1 Tax=Deinococcus sp. YIM 77859 TaxID=1540221 RepID=UPI00054FBE43|nr:helix-turn-helix domain-containing protein [Deinococcus sp. YIM 77859]